MTQAQTAFFTAASLGLKNDKKRVLNDVIRGIKETVDTNSGNIDSNDTTIAAITGTLNKYADAFSVSGSTTTFSGLIVADSIDVQTLNAANLQFSGDQTINGDFDVTGSVSIGGGNIELNSDGTTEYLAPIATGITESNVSTKVSHSFIYPDNSVGGGEGVVLALGMQGRGRAYLTAEHPTTNKDSIDLGIYAGHGSTFNKAAAFRSDGSAKFYRNVLVGNYLCAEVNTSATGNLKLGSSTSRVWGPVINLTSRDVPEVVSGTKNESVVIDAGKSGSNNDAAIHLKTGAGNTVLDRLVITSGGTVQIPGALTIGGTAAANTIDDYEEGTWTPALNWNNVTYTLQQGKYTKIGNRIFFSINLVWSANDASSLTSINLPFLSTSVNERATVSVQDKGIPGNFQYPVADIFSGTVYIRYVNTSGAYITNYGVAANDAGRIAITGNYAVS